MNNLEFLDKLNNFANKKFHNSIVDLGIFDVNGNTIGVSMHNTNTDSYIIYAYVEDNEEVKNCGEITFTFKSSYFTDKKNESGHIDYLIVKPEYRNKKTSTSIRNKGLENLHIGSFLLELAEQMLVNGAKFEKIYLDRKKYNNNSSLFDISYNQNYLFYNKHNYFKDETTKPEWSSLEPYIKRFKQNSEFVGFSEMYSEEFENSKYFKLAKYFENYTKEEGTNFPSFNLIMDRQSETPYLIADYLLNSVDNSYKAECYLINEREQKIECVGNMYYNKNTKNCISNNNKIMACDFASDTYAKAVGEQLLKYCEDRLFSFGVRKIGYNPQVILKVFKDKMPKINGLTTDGVNYYKQQTDNNLVRVCPLKFIAQKK